MLVRFPEQRLCKPSTHHCVRGCANRAKARNSSGARLESHGAQHGKSATEENDLNTKATESSQRSQSLRPVSSSATSGFLLRALRVQSFLCEPGSGACLTAAGLASRPFAPLRKGSKGRGYCGTKSSCLAARLSAKNGMKKRLSRQPTENKPPDGLAKVTPFPFLRGQVRPLRSRRQAPSG